MTIRILVGRQEGFISSIGFSVNGVYFLNRGKQGRGLMWEGPDAKHLCLQELRALLLTFKAGGAVIENEEVLKELER